MLTDEDKILFKQIQADVLEMIEFDEFKEAFVYLEKLSAFIKKKDYEHNDKEFYRALTLQVARLYWVALPLLKKEQVSWLFDNYFSQALEMVGYDLYSSFKHFLLSFVLQADRDSFKQEIKNGLERNQLIITAAKLAGDRNPTIENWLKVYIGEVGLGTVDKIKIQQFLTNNVNSRKLTSEEREKIKKMFDFYEKLKLSSLTVVGNEDIVPVATEDFNGYIRDGRIERASSLTSEQQRLLNIIAGKDVDSNYNVLALEKEKYQKEGLAAKAIDETLSKKNKLDELHKVADSYKSGSLQRRAVEEEIKKLELKQD